MIDENITLKKENLLQKLLSIIILIILRIISNRLGKTISLLFLLCLILVSVLYVNDVQIVEELFSDATLSEVVEELIKNDDLPETLK